MHLYFSSEYKGFLNILNSPTGARNFTHLNRFETNMHASLSLLNTTQISYSSFEWMFRAFESLGFFSCSENDLRGHIIKPHSNKCKTCPAIIRNLSGFSLFFFNKSQNSNYLCIMNKMHKERLL